MKLKISFLFLIMTFFLFSISQASATNWEHQIISFDSVSHLTEGDSSSVVIAVVDSGIDYTHTEFDSNLLWTNPDEIVNNGIDDDSNGYIDDFRGWDFVENDSDTLPIPKDVDSNNNGRKDEKIYHGTFIAGILSARGMNIDRGFVPNVKLLDLRVFDTDGFLPNKNYLVLAFEYILDLIGKGVPIKVINYSIVHNFGESNDFSDLISKLSQLGVIIVAGSGNDRTSGRNRVDYPANHPDVIGVGAVDIDSKLAEFSRYGENLSLVAPGKNVYSTVNGNKYFTDSGTSYATPFVAGTLAFVWSIKPSISRTQMISLLLNSTNDLGDLGKDVFYGYGLLNVTKMIINAGIDVESVKTTNFELLSGIISLTFLIIIGRRLNKKK